MEDPLHSGSNTVSGGIPQDLATNDCIRTLERRGILRIVVEANLTRSRNSDELQGKRSRDCRGALVFHPFFGHYLNENASNFLNNFPSKMI